jgi:ParB family chromosome partitioning protein
MKLKDIPVEQLRPDPNQPRLEFPRPELENLAASLVADGQLVPLIAYLAEEKPWIADGQRRWLAAQIAGLSTLSAVVLDTAPTAGELLKLQLQVNCLREGLRPIERALAYQRLMEQEGCTQREIAKLLNVSDATVSNYLAVLKLPDEIQSRIDSGQLPLSSACAIARAADTTMQRTLADQAVSGGLSRDALQGRMRRKEVNGVKVKRVTCVLGEHTVTIAGRQQTDLDGVVAVLEELLRDARRARNQRLDVLTWVRVLRDRSKASAENGALAESC